MPDLLIRNLPSDIHIRLKAAAANHRRSVTQETIATLELGLRARAAPLTPSLPEPLKPRRPITMKETLRHIDNGLELRGMPHTP